MGIDLDSISDISFITFETEIGYQECIKLKEFQFGNDLLRIEPGQDKGNIPTSVKSIVLLPI